jgi:hypothetical protein
MYNNQDLDEAVAAGALSADAAASLRTYFDDRRQSPAIDEEQFRLITGFNDIFVSIASAILLFAVGWIGQSLSATLGLTVDARGPGVLAPAFVAATAWGLALFFTARRRMALPSILLLLAFVGGLFATTLFALVTGVGDAALDDNVTLGAILAAVAAAVAAGGAWLHWKRFHVPITIAAGAAAVAGLVIALLVSSIGPVDDQSMKTIVLTAVLLLGVAMFLFAMRWDSSDPSRLTRRSDVAFWLHLLAAPMIVHPVFTLLGLNDGNATIGEGLVVVALYVALAITALAIDRRALLVSALAYVLYALSELFKQVGAVELNVALTALIIGSALLLLSAFWHQARRTVVGWLPGGITNRLPHVDRVAAIPQPAA